MSNFLSFFQTGTINSSSRLIGFIVVMNALALIDFIILYELLGPDKPGITELLLAAGGLFIQITGPVFYWLFKQKKTEISQTINKNS